MFGGLYPAIHDRPIDAAQWLGSYMTTYVERDARGGLDWRSRHVSAVSGLCAGRSGQLLNLSSFGAEAGVSHSTARRWLSVLRASYIVTVLAPHHENFSKRIVKTPKLYFLDTGLLCALLGLRRAEDLWNHPLRGALVETFVVSELIKLLTHNGERARLFFWRDSHGIEVDALIDLGRERVAVEVKSGSTVTSDAFRGLETYQRLRRTSGGESSAPCWCTAVTSGTNGAATMCARGGRARRRGMEIAMTVCAACGAENPGKAKFCMECAAPLAAARGSSRGSGRSRHSRRPRRPSQASVSDCGARRRRRRRASDCRGWRARPGGITIPLCHWRRRM